MNKRNTKWMPRELKRIIKRFRILDDWTIKYDTQNEYKGQCSVSEKRKLAVIYDWGSRGRPKDYFLHEVLHIVFRAVMYSRKVDKYLCGRENEEISVQDLCIYILQNY